MMINIAQLSTCNYYWAHVTNNTTNMNIDNKTRKQVLSILKKVESHLSVKDKKIIELFEEPIALNVFYNREDYTFKKEGAIHLEPKIIKHLIRKGYLYFDFSADAEEDKKFYEEHNDEWKDEYSYNKVGSLDTDADSNYGYDEGDMFFVMEDDEGLVDPCRFDIREIEYVDETHFDVIDRGCHKGDKRRFVLRR